MPSIRETHRLPYTAEQMFDLVADVETDLVALGVADGKSNRTTDGRSDSNSYDFFADCIAHRSSADDVLPRSPKFQK